MKRPTSSPPGPAAAAYEPWLSWPAPLADWSRPDGATGTGAVGPGGIEATWYPPADITLESGSGPAAIDSKAVDGAPNAAMAALSEIPTDSVEELD